MASSPPSSLLYERYKDVWKKPTSCLQAPLPLISIPAPPVEAIDDSSKLPPLSDLNDENIPTGEYHATPPDDNSIYPLESPREETAQPRPDHSPGLWLPHSNHPQRPLSAAADARELPRDSRETPVFGQLSQSESETASELSPPPYPQHPEEAASCVQPMQPPAASAPSLQPMQQPSAAAWSLQQPAAPASFPQPMQQPAAAVWSLQQPATAASSLQPLQQPTAPIAVQQQQQQEEEAAPPASPPPPDPEPYYHTLLALARPSWKMAEEARPPQLLQEQLDPIPVATPPKASGKNLLARGRPPAKTDDAPAVEEERKEREGEEGEDEDGAVKEENTLLHDRFVRRLAIERRASDDRIETEELLRERDRLVGRRELSREALATAVERDERTRGHSHDGRWRVLLCNAASPKSKWFKRAQAEDRSHTEEDPEQGTLGKRSESQYTNDSLVSDELEHEMNGDMEHLHWQRGFIVNYFPKSDTMMEAETFTLQGRLFLKTKLDPNLASMRVKFAITDNGEAIVRKSSYSTSLLFSVNLRHGKLIKIDSTAIVAYRHPNSARPHIMWSDDIGLIPVRDDETNKFDTPVRRTVPLMEPLRVVQIKMQAEHGPPERYLDPRKWQIQNISELAEESELEGAGALHDAAWPRLAQRVDDLNWVEEDREGTIYLRSPSFPDRLVQCRREQWMREERDELSRHYRKLRFTAVMVPFEPHTPAREHHWQCLVLAPLPFADRVTEGRIFNYRPLDSLVAMRKESLPAQWSKEEDEAPYKVVLLDTESR